MRLGSGFAALDGWAAELLTVVFSCVVLCFQETL